jgi:hypothetical protein
MVRSLRENVTVFLICVCSVFILRAGTDEEFFLRGNNYYVQEDYENALHAYNMISHKGSAVFYNMGNCFFHHGEYAQALVSWLRAEDGASSRDLHCIARNKEIVLKKLGKQSEKSPWYALNVSVLFLQLLFLVCLWVFMVMLRKKQIGLRKLAQGCLCFCIAVCAVMLGEQYVRHSKHSAVVVTKEAKLLTGPDKSFHVVAPLGYAERVKIKEARERWYKIQYAGMIGWVEADDIQIV